MTGAIASPAPKPMHAPARLVWTLLLAVVVGLRIVSGDSIGLNEGLLSTMARRHGEDARNRLLEWERMILFNRILDDREKLTLVNEFFNRLAFVEDQVNWGSSDYWATPVEMIAINGGDCEDFAVAKYFTLKELGIPMEKLRITYVKATSIQQAHMVLAYYPTPDAEPLILDNLIDEIRPGSERPDLIPVHTFNGDGLWLARERGSGRRLGASHEYIDLWRDLTARMDEEKRY